MKKIKLFGSYENYLNKLDKFNIVNDEFMLKYYPELIDDKQFRFLLNELDPYVRNNIKFVLGLYESINKFNDYKHKIFIFMIF